jgi:transcriptional regulator with XRE-family HTH domain
MPGTAPGGERRSTPIAVQCVDRSVHHSSPVGVVHQPVATMHQMPDPDVVAAAVARNTRRLRTARRWSLDRLATRSGVSKGMLVHLEQARTNPSLGTLCKVAETLGVSLAALVELHEAPVVRVVQPDETAQLWSGLEGSRGDLLVGSDERDHLELWRWSLAAGDDHRSDPHVEGTREMLHVIDGTLTLEVDGLAHTVVAGGAALFQADRPHAYRNDRKRPVRFVMLVLQPDADLEQWASTHEAGGGDAEHGDVAGDTTSPA